MTRTVSCEKDQQKQWPGQCGEVKDSLEQCESVSIELDLIRAVKGNIGQ